MSSSSVLHMIAIARIHSAVLYLFVSSFLPVAPGRVAG